jgi:hypothetical protein
LGERAQTLEDERHMHGGGKVGHTKNLPKREKKLGYEHMSLDYFAISPMYGEELFKH